MQASGFHLSSAPLTPAAPPESPPAAELAPEPLLVGARGAAAHPALGESASELVAQGPLPLRLQPLLLRVSELSVLLSVSERTVKRMARANELPGMVHLGRSVRFRRSVIEKWIEQGCPRPGRRVGRR